MAPRTRKSYSKVEGKKQMRIGPQHGPLGLAALGGLSVQDVYNLARDAGFTPDVARSMVAIAQRESGLNPAAYASSVAGSTEASYGLWQINMSGTMGVARLLQFGISSPSQLLDPATNAAAAYSLSSGGTNLSPWHIDSDTAVINGKTVNLGYRTKYLAFLASLPGDLEANYTGAPTISDPASVNDLQTEYVPPIDASSDLSWALPAVIALGVLWALVR